MLLTTRALGLGFAVSLCVLPRAVHAADEDGGTPPSSTARHACAR